MMHAATRPSSKSENAGRADPLGLDAATQLKAWLAVLDAVLVAIEQTAWQAREIGQRARQAFIGVHGGVGKVVAGSRALADELTAWPERLTRLGATGLTLTKIAATYRLHQTKAAFLSKTRAQRSLDELHAANARRFYELSVKQGGAFLKVGQMLSARPDLLPAPWINELGKLQDAAPEVAYEAIKHAVERERGVAIERVFASFEERPVASASIGQVHKATLHDGRIVAVKVQRPNIAELVGLDLELLEMFARGLAESLPPVDMETIVREVRAMILAELDYEREAEVTAKVAKFFASDAHIFAPEVIEELTSSRMLVTEFMPGEKITNVLERLKNARAEGDDAAKAALTRVLTRVLEAYARQVLDLGIFQADPHPGNLLVTEDGVLTVLDFGCAKELDARGQDALIDLGSAFIFGDATRMAEAMEALGFETDSGSREGLLAYAKLVLKEVEAIRKNGGGWPDQAEVLAQLTRFSKQIEDDPITRLPVVMVMLGRVFGTLAGLFLHYAPDINATSAVLPLVLTRLAARRSEAPAA